MKYTINKLAKLAGVTVRTLHHYDQIGLLKPSLVGDNGYRYYDTPEAIRLQQIMFFRELEFPLSEIKQILNSPKFKTTESLLEQKKLLMIKQLKIVKLMKTIDQTILKTQNNTIDVDGDLFESFSDLQMNQYKAEAKARWGKTDAYIESQKRTKNWSKADYNKFAVDSKKFTQALADSMDLPVSDQRAQELIKQHHQGIEVFYTCPKEMYRELGRMYVTDPRFTAYYDKFRPGLAQWVCDAIQYFCDQN